MKLILCFNNHCFCANRCSEEELQQLVLKTLQCFKEWHFVSASAKETVTSKKLILHRRGCIAAMLVSKARTI